MSNENLYTPGCIRTFTGKYINPCKPDQELICIEDIAHALSMQPRFGGNLPVFYSVAQHCIKVAELVNPSLRLAALLHDASEAYLIDVPRPVKEQLTNYRDIEENLMCVIAAKFGFYWPMHPDIKEADETRLAREWEVYMLNTEPLSWIKPMSFEAAKRVFIQSFNQYYNDTH